MREKVPQTLYSFEKLGEEGEEKREEQEEMEKQKEKMKNKV